MPIERWQQSVGYLCTLYVVLLVLGPPFLWLPFRLDDVLRPEDGILLVLAVIALVRGERWNQPALLTLAVSAFFVFPIINLALLDRGDPFWVREVVRAAKYALVLYVFSRMTDWSPVRALAIAIPILVTVQLIQMGEWTLFDSTYGTTANPIRPSGTIGNPNVTGIALFAAVLVASTILSSAVDRRKWLWAVLIFGPVGIVLTQSRMAVGALALVGIVMLFSSKLPDRRKVWGVIGMMVLITTLVTGFETRAIGTFNNDASLAMRVGYLHDLSTLVHNSPSFVGPLTDNMDFLLGFPDFEYGHLVLWYGFPGLTLLGLWTAVFITAGRQSVNTSHRWMLTLLGLALPLLALTGSAMFVQTFPLWLIVLMQGLFVDKEGDPNYVA